MFITKLWRVHPYREGNTRTVSIFMKLFAHAKELDFNAQIPDHPGYLRSALILAAVEESQDPQYLLTMISDALNLDTTMNAIKNDEEPNSYQVIKQHDVSKYEEKPFKTDSDSK
jgi:cell filamentation protein